MDATLTSLSAAQLRRAAELKEQIESLQDELSGLFGGAAPVNSTVTTQQPGRKRVLSPAAIARIRAAQKLRWAAYRGAKGATYANRAPQAKRRMPPAARARLAAIARARWARAKATGKNAL